MEDPSLNVKVLLLVRDPRGTMQSRKHRVNEKNKKKLDLKIVMQDWCPGNPDCDDPAKLCGDLVSDYQAFKQLNKEFPGRYK